MELYRLNRVDVGDFEVLLRVNTFKCKGRKREENPIATNSCLGTRNLELPDRKKDEVIEISDDSEDEGFSGHSEEPRRKKRKVT